MKSEHIDLIDKVYDENYYVEIFESMLSDMELTVEEAKEIPTGDVPHFWNQFWIELPDSQAIHRTPFYEICDMAEGIFDDEDEDYFDDEDDEDF